MERLRLTLGGTASLHARPAARFAQTAKRFVSQIDVSAGERRANAKSILALLMLNLGPGAVIELSAEGDDEREAVAALRAVIESGSEVET